MEGIIQDNEDFYNINSQRKEDSSNELHLEHLYALIDEDDPNKKYEEHLNVILRKDTLKKI